jgi:hypothetical protein
MEAWVTKLNKSTTLSILGFKVLSGVRQLGSLYAYAEGISPITFTANMLELLGEPTRIAEKLQSLLATETMLGRSQNLNIEVKQLLSTPEYKQFMSNPSFAKALLLNAIMGDRIAVSLGGYARYKALTDAGMSEEAALKDFADMTKKTQQAAQLSEQSDIQRGSPLVQAFTKFQSANNAMAQRELVAIRGMITKRLPYKEGIYRLFLYQILMPMIGMFITDLGFVPKRQVMAVMMGPWSGVLVFSQLLETIARIVFKERTYGDVMTTAVFNAIEGIPDSLKKIIDAAEDPSLEAVFEALWAVSARVAGPAIGLPIENIGRIAEGIMDLTMEDRDDTKLQGAAKIIGAPKSTVKRLGEE